MEKANASTPDPRELAFMQASLDQLAPIPPGEMAFLAPLLRPVHLRKGDCLERAGEVSQLVGFVLEGVLRKHLVSSTGREWTRGFAGPGDWVAGYLSLLTGEPSPLSIEALTETRLLVLPSRVIGELYARNPCWERVGRKLSELHLIERERRAMELISLSATDRYQRFLSTHAHLLYALRNADLASYLGITPQSLSRVRARRARASQRDRQKNN